MLCDQNPSHERPSFDLPSTEEVVALLLGLVETSLHSFKETTRQSWPELEVINGVVDERFDNANLSQIFQLNLAGSVLNGKVSVHDDAALLEGFLKKGKKGGIPRQVDIGIRLAHTRNYALVIEGKRLHDKNDKQYVSGNTGGIARFKRNQHGQNLNKACMVGYMENESFTFWRERVNQWIGKEKSKSSDLLWLEDETLSEPAEISATLARCSSCHQRISNTEIELQHFWVDVR